MNETQTNDTVRPDQRGQSPSDHDEGDTFGATGDGLPGDGAAGNVDGEQTESGDRPESAEEARDEGNAPTDLPSRVATATEASRASAAERPQERVFLVTLRIAMTGDDAAHPSIAPHAYVVAGPQTTGLAPIDRTPALMRRVALGDPAALGPILLALPGEYAARDTARKVEAAAKAEAAKQERKEQQAARRRESAAAKNKVDLLAAAKKAGSALAGPTPTATGEPTVPDAVLPSGPSAPMSAGAGEHTVPASSDPGTAARPAPRTSPTPSVLKTPGTVNTPDTSPLQPSLFS